MLVIRSEQINEMLLVNRRLLIRDIEDHLIKYRQHVVAAYPRPYLR